jgi:hypothetical protein
MHAIDGGRRFDDRSPGFERLCSDVFARPVLTIARPPLHLVSSDGRARTRGARRGCGTVRRHLRVVDGGRR